jgi:hypothetical protein
MTMMGSFATAFAAVVAVGTASAPPVEAAPGDTTVYVPLTEPQRLLDTRVTSTPLGAGGVVTVRVVGDAPLPPAASAQAVVLNVTVVGPAAAGYWTVFPHGASLPVASNLNIDERASALGAALAIPNLVTVPIGADGSVDIFSLGGGHVVVDVFGTYELSGPTAAGRFTPLASPSRILDTRNVWPVGSDSTTEVRVPGAGGASAAVLNVTTIASGAGFWTVFPASAPTRPGTANLNSLFPFHVAANQVIVPLDADGDFSVYSQTGGHLVVDVVGLITGPTAPVSADGLFVPLTSPTRFLDTRDPSLHPLGKAQMALPTWNLEVPVTSNAAIGRSDVSAVVANLTSTDALAAGYLSLSPAGASNPAVKSRSTSTLNVTRAGQTLPNHATVAVSARGFDVFTQSGANIVVDVAGFYTGAPVPAPFGSPSNADPTPFACAGFPTTPATEVVTGSSRSTVARVQQRLLALGFWVQSADGVYGLTTRQAVMAFQKWARLPATSAVDEATAAALNRTLCRPAPGITGDGFEVDKGQQLGFIVRNGRAVWVLNVSTGSGKAYTERNQRTGGIESGISITPSGTWKVYFERPEGWWDGDLGSIYRPKYFRGGVAVHGSPSIPNYPASHGCVRVSVPAMDMIWGTDAIPRGSRVVVRD